MKTLRIAGIVVGVGLLFLLIRAADPGLVKDTLGLLGWKYTVVLVYPLIWMTLNTVGWKYALHSRSGSIPIRHLFGIRLAGEAFNSLLPSSYVGGEPVKAKLLSTHVPLREATSSVLIAKAAQSIGLLFYIGLGLVIGLPPGTASHHQAQAWIALGILSAGVLTFTWLLAHQSFSRLGRTLHRITRWEWLRSQEARLDALDDSLGAFYSECKGRFGASIFWHSVGWIAGMLELVIIFHLMGEPVSWRAAWFMGALAQLGSVIGLISPGGLGFYEGGHYMAAAILGLPPGLGLTASFIRRIREIVWTALGLLLFWRYSKTQRSTAKIDNRK